MVKENQFEAGTVKTCLWLNLKGRGFSHLATIEFNNSTYSKRQTDKCWWESLRQDDLVCGLHVILLPPGHLRTDLLHAAGHHIARHGEEARRQNWLRVGTWLLLFCLYLSLTWAKRPYLTSLRHTAWSSRLQSQPGMLSSRACWQKQDKLLFYVAFLFLVSIF